MKKFLLVFIFFCFITMLFAQTNSTVDVADEVYYILSHAEARGLCTTLSTVRPYTEKYIVDKLDEILLSLERLEDRVENPSDEQNVEIADDEENPDEDSVLSDTEEADRLYKKSTEYEVILREKTRFTRNKEKGFKGDLQHLGFRVDGDLGKMPVSLEFNDSVTGFVSAGLYSGTDSSVGYEVFNNFNFKGDIGNNVSYYADGYIGLTKMPLEFMGTYDVGYWWYDNDGILIPAPFDTTDPKLRRINTYRNRPVIPYSYSKYWSGSIRHIGNLNAGGLTDWCEVDSLAFGMLGEIHASFLDNRIELGVSRVRREWGAMDNGASLVMNSMARPFFAFDNTIHLFPQISLSGLTGFLEFPNQNYINANAWYMKDDSHADFLFFQNAFSIGQLDLDFKYVHFDFGSTVVWPKRFDLGYAFPLIDRIVYQDVLGDCDNLALFANLKLRNPGIGSVWISGYLDEMPEINPIKIVKEMFVLDRYMFALQVGTKIVLPFLPFATLSFRYTKLEPYCYTHQAVNYVPWYYGRYISESYTNNGESLGYYLPPNSDEFHIRIETRPTTYSSAAVQYQLVRHGADFGSRQVDGSSLYSELSLDRAEMKKYFLCDGAYEWSNIITLQGSYDFKQFKLPVVLNCSLGIVASIFTDTDSALGEKGDYHTIETDEYKRMTGFVVTVGFTLFGR